MHRRHHQKGAAQDAGTQIYTFTFTLTYGNETEEYGDEAVTIRPDDVRFGQGNIQIPSAIHGYQDCL